MYSSLNRNSVIQKALLLLALLSFPLEITAEITIRGKSAFQPCRADISLTGIKVVTCDESAIGKEIPSIILDGWEVNEFIFNASIWECKAENFRGLQKLDRVNLTMLNVEFKRFSFACFQSSAAMFEKVYLKGSPRQLENDFDFDVYFHDIYNVRLLTIDSIRVSNIPNSIIKTGQIPVMEKLILRNTQLTRIDPGAFKSTQLKEIEFDKQDPPRISGFLDSINEWLRPIENLEIIRFKNIPFPISSTRVYLLNLNRVMRRRLKVLEFDNCQINDISNTHHGLSLGEFSKGSLKELILSNNPIESYAEKEWLTGLQAMNQLEVLNITQNKLPLAQPFPNWMRRYENFPFREFHFYKDIIENIPSLSLPLGTRVVDFKGSQIRKATSSWSRNCKQMTRLSFEEVRLESVVVNGALNNWGELLTESIESLEEINLAGTGLKSNDLSDNIPIVQNFRNLKLINLSNNYIASFVQSFHRLPDYGGLFKTDRLTVDLTGNKIERIDECEFLDDLGFEPLNVINLAKNPLICDCELAWIQGILFKKKLNINCGLNDESKFSTNQIYTEDLSSQCPSISCKDQSSNDNDNMEDFIQITGIVKDRKEARIKLNRQKLKNIFANGLKGYKGAISHTKEILQRLSSETRSKFSLVTWSRTRPEKQLLNFNEIPNKEIVIENVEVEVPLMLMFYSTKDEYYVKMLHLNNEGTSTTTRKVTKDNDDDKDTDDAVTKGGISGKTFSLVIGLTVGSILVLSGLVIGFLLCKLKKKKKNEMKTKHGTVKGDLNDPNKHLVDEKNYPRDPDMPQLPGRDIGEYVDSENLNKRPIRVKSEDGTVHPDNPTDDLYYDERTMRKSMLSYPGGNKKINELDDKYFETYNFLPRSPHQ